MSTTKLAAGSSFPEILLPLVQGSKATLGSPEGGCDWKMVVVYRGKHCPRCTKYLAQLDALKDQFHDLSVDVLAVSGDPKEKAERQNDGALGIPVAYGLSVEQMQSLGLYISHPRSPEETDRPFPEPGLFVVNAEGMAQVVDISNAPFSRPDLDQVLSGLRFIRDPENNYPVRGTYV